MLFNLLDDCFLLDPSFESFESAFNRFTFFNNDKRQEYSPPYGKMEFITEYLRLVKRREKESKGMPLNLEGLFPGWVDCQALCLPPNYFVPKPVNRKIN